MDPQKLFDKYPVTYSTIVGLLFGLLAGYAIWGK